MDAGSPVETLNHCEAAAKMGFGPFLFLEQVKLILFSVVILPMIIMIICDDEYYEWEMRKHKVIIC